MTWSQNEPSVRCNVQKYFQDSAHLTQNKSAETWQHAEKKQTNKKQTPSWMFAQMLKFVAWQKMEKMKRKQQAALQGAMKRGKTNITIVSEL